MTGAAPALTSVAQAQPDTEPQASRAPGSRPPAALVRGCCAHPDLGPVYGVWGLALEACKSRIRLHARHVLRPQPQLFWNSPRIRKGLPPGTPQPGPSEWDPLAGAPGSLFPPRGPGAGTPGHRLLWLAPRSSGLLAGLGDCGREGHREGHQEGHQPGQRPVAQGCLSPPPCPPRCPPGPVSWPPSRERVSHPCPQPVLC